MKKITLVTLMCGLLFSLTACSTTSAEENTTISTEKSTVTSTVSENDKQINELLTNMNKVMQNNVKINYFAQYMSDNSTKFDSNTTEDQADLDIVINNTRNIDESYKNGITYKNETIICNSDSSSRTVEHEHYYHKNNDVISMYLKHDDDWIEEPIEDLDKVKPSYIINIDNIKYASLSMKDNEYMIQANATLKDIDPYILEHVLNFSNITSNNQITICAIFDKETNEFNYIDIFISKFQSDNSIISDCSIRISYKGYTKEDLELPQLKSDIAKSEKEAKDIDIKTAKELYEATKRTMAVYEISKELNYIHNGDVLYRMYIPNKIELDEKVKSTEFEKELQSNLNVGGDIQYIADKMDHWVVKRFDNTARVYISNNEEDTMYQLYPQTDKEYVVE